MKLAKFRSLIIQIYVMFLGFGTIVMGENKKSLQVQNDKIRFPVNQASVFARLALKGIQKEYPNSPGHVMAGPQDRLSPRELHPSFYGCYDWHSAVHGHWMLIKLLRHVPDLPEKEEILTAIRSNLSAKNLQTEADYFKRPNTQSFERTYGWAWLLKLAEELHTWDHADARELEKNLQPLVDVLVARYLAFLPKQNYPIRRGVHPNTAFGISFALDYARAVDNKDLIKLLQDRTKSYFGKDQSIPAQWEPDGDDFFSPSLMEADLMRRVLSPKEFHQWLQTFLPDLAKGQPKTLFQPVQVTDRTDPKLVHLDGLNLSRAWCLRNIANSLPPDDPSRKPLMASALAHSQAGLAHVSSGDYAGEHWLASFAVFYLATNYFQND